MAQTSAGSSKMLPAAARASAIGGVVEELGGK